MAHVNPGALPVQPTIATSNNTNNSIQVGSDGSLGENPDHIAQIGGVDFRKRHISQVSSTPNKIEHPDKHTKLHDTTSSSLEEESILNVSGVFVQKETMDAETQHSEPDSPKSLKVGEMTEERFCTLFLTILKQPKIRSEMVLISNEKLQDLQNQIEVLKEELETKNAVISDMKERDLEMEDRIDTLEQKLRLKNVRITGENEIEGDEDVAKTALNILSNLGCKISPNQIDNAYRLGKKSEDKTRGILIEFNSLKTKRIAYKARTLLKSKHRPGVWMSEDLTPARSNTMFECRNLKRAELLHDYWSNEGEIFVKQGEHLFTEKVGRVEDLLKYIPNGSDVRRPTRLPKKNN